MARNKIRFDVFKRDGFTCQYCGRTPPAVVLELDHIMPRSKGGPDNVDNYITTCFECNRGKGKHTLNTVVPGAEEKVELLKERRLQLKAFNRLIEKQEAEQGAAVDGVVEVFRDNFPDRQPTDKFKETTIKRFVTLLPLTKIKSAMTLACSTKAHEPEQALRYFCGICWNWIKRPETREW